jgi:hypothetical protein
MENRQRFARMIFVRQGGGRRWAFARRGQQRGMAGIRPQRLSALSLHLHSSKKKRKNRPAGGSEMKKQSCSRWEAIAEKQMTNPRMASTLHRRAANRRPYGLGFDIRAFLWPSERKS